MKDIGIAKPTNRADLVPNEAKTTIITSAIAVRTADSRESTIPLTCLELSREKSLLISEIERLSKAPGDKTNVAATMRNQIESIEEAAREREEAYQQQINQLENNLSKQRRLNEERASQHEVELTSYKEIARLEAGPGDRKSRNTKSTNKRFQSINGTRRISNRCRRKK